VEKKGIEGMIKGVGHIGIAVRDIVKSLETICRVLDVPIPAIRDNPERKMKVAVVPLENLSLEVLEDYSADGMFAKYVRERGNAIHHLCFLTDDMDSDLRALEERGVEWLNRRPTVGLRGKQIVFSTPSALDGIPLELSEP
jgi:methylmalonyl-CoA/ethylmalonyl-CoA epimerase